MTAFKNVIKLLSVLLISLIGSFLLLHFSIIDIEKIISLKEDFQYNAISMSAIIGGFLFTGIGILISAIDKERIKRLWENNYLDNLYRAAFAGMISNVVTIISSFILLCTTVNLKFLKIILYIEIISLIIGVVFFIWCIKQLIFIIKRMKK